MSDSVKKFVQVVNPFGRTRKRLGRLFNISFFLGAGFSKSWDNRFPLGSELFKFSCEDWKRQDGPLDEFLNLCNYETVNLDIDYELFRDIVYKISMMSKYPDIRPRYIDEQNLVLIERHLRYLVAARFSDLAQLNYERDGMLPMPNPISKEQREIIDFFNLLDRYGDGSSGIPEGLRTHFLSTNYDFIVETIIDQLNAGDGGHQAYTYRGITPTSHSGKETHTPVHDHYLVRNLIKINGGFEIFHSSAGFEFDYRTPLSKDVRRHNPPQIVLPSREQDYSQSYFRCVFPKAVRLLQESEVLILVGYSLPEDDALLRLLLRQFAEDRADGDRKLLFYIDYGLSEKDQLEKLARVFPHAEQHRGLSIIPYKGSFSDWCQSVVATQR